MELWKPVDYCDGIEVSNKGRVRSWNKQIRKVGSAQKSGFATVRATVPKVLAQIKIGSRSEYLAVNLKSHGETQHRLRLVHRLVLTAFRGVEKGKQVRHLDGNPKNNCLTNLAWGTAKQNAKDRDKHGTTKRRISDEQVKQIRALRGRQSAAQVAQKFQIAKVYLYMIWSGKRR